MIALGALDELGLAIRPDDDPAWDRRVAAWPGGDLVQTARWAATKRALGFTMAHAVLPGPDGPEGGAWITIRRFGPLGAVGYVARGPLLAPGRESRAGELVELLERTARRHRVRHLIVQPPEGGEAVERALARRGYAPGALEVAPTATVRIDLGQDLERILARMSASQRSHVRRSERAGVVVTTGGDAELGAFHALHEATGRRHGFRPLTQDYLTRQWQALHPGGHVQIFLARHEGRLLAGIWVSAFGPSVTYRLPGWSGNDPKLYPSAACFWAAIRWAKAQGHRWFDFGGLERAHARALVEGTAPPASFHDSPDAMKVRFGGDPVLLPEAWQRTLVPGLWPLVRRVYPLIAGTRAWQAVTHRLRSG